MSGFMSERAEWNCYVVTEPLLESTAVLSSYGNGRLLGHYRLMVGDT